MAKRGQILVSVVTAVDKAIRYEGCLPIFRGSWRIVSFFSPRIKFVPFVVRVQEGPFSRVVSSSRNGLIFQTPHSTGFIAQNIRVLAASLAPGDLVLTTDVDLIPLSYTYFEKVVEPILQGVSDLVVTRDILEGEFPIGYFIASPDNFRKISQVAEMEDLAFAVNRVASDLPENFVGRRGEGNFWNLDQRLLYEWATARTDLRLRKFSDEETRFRRISRRRSGKNSVQRYMRLAKGKVTDFHLPLPVSRNLGYIWGVWLLSLIGLLYRRVSDILKD